MKQIRKNFSNLKVDFYSGKSSSYDIVFELIRLQIIVFICVGMLVITCAFCCLLNIKKLNNNNIITISILILVFEILLMLDKLPLICKLVNGITDNIFRDFFGKYGNVITKKDWKRIKKSMRQKGRKISRRKAYGYCYSYSWMLALFLDDAQLLCCSIRCQDGSKTCHFAILKNNCVFDTNNWIHYDYEEYIQLSGCDIFNIYTYEEYVTPYFFENIRDDLVEWCHQNKVYIDENF